ncbi:ATP-dependent chromatin assembly factor large subunit [Nesidiocoris tenuis]|uniref:ATP-dependent chromatin assembly factor large subunit n=1 Tax=Nesidiocoris tenuis TaxID=355587 RepID=A0ABN7BBM3_9HEMI|nr:ATP-dependent chromatin assembly factor large subunit [Nesidiocoris tenuis]
MPLLHKKPFVPEEYPVELKENDEVFVCHSTKEIFKDYDDFCERIILCNSLVWSCSLTGRSNLTYQEAAASEEKVKRLLKRFPMELREPVLYLSSICERRSLVELAEEVYSFVKDRFFIGENVEVDLPEGTESCSILGVIPPKPEELKHFEKVKDKDERHSPPAVSYKYKIELVESSKILTVKAEQLSRRKSAYSKDKNKLYIKQFVHNNQGIWRLKESANAKFGINNIEFSQIFCGDPPDMNPKKPVKTKANPEKAKKQETINKYFNKSSPKKNGLPPKKSPKKNGAQPTPTPEKVKRKSKKEIEEEKAREEALKKEKLMRQKAKILENRAKYCQFVKEWNMVREDLECEDLKEMPTPHPLICNVPSEYLGDIIAIMEFLRSFNKILTIKDFFPHGVNFELLERALNSKEIVGPFSDLLQLLLVRIFGLQDGELDEIKDYDFKGSFNLLMDRGEDEIIKLSKFAAKTEIWVKRCHGLPLGQLQLDTSTITEMLRLHLLMSGALHQGSKTNKWRYQARGGYFSSDDPGLHLRMNHPDLIEKLASQSVFDLEMGEKLLLVKCLIDQILTYSASRDIIEEGCEKAKQCRAELRALRQEQARKEKEEALRLKDLKKSGAANPPEAKVEPEENDKEDEERKTRERELRSGPINMSKMESLIAELGVAVRSSQLTPLGTDRAYRRYWFVQSIPALLVEDHDDFRGPCLPRCTPSASFNSEDSLAYIKMLFKQKHSNKENISAKPENIVSSSPKKLLAEKNGETSPIARNRTKSESSPLQPLTCWADPENCPVHKANTNRPVWSFVKDKSELERLILSLNKRGFRERKLKEALIEERTTITKALEKFPLHLFSGDENVEPSPDYKQLAAKIQKVYDADNLGYPEGTPIDDIVERSLRDYILETEEKISGGALGVLKVKSREIWRDAINENGYDRQCKQLIWGARKEETMEVDVEHSSEEKEDEESRSSTPSQEYVATVRHRYPKGFEPVPQKPVIADLASAVVQVAQSIEHKFLKPPLGLNPKDKNGRIPTDTMERWETAVMESTSCSQLFLHLSTLENSVLWNRSAMNAFCRICRRKTDPENMLLCDACNKGHHMYCLKPKLTKVPAGDWFCQHCKPAEIPTTRPKKRKMFSDDSDEEDEELVEIDTTCNACKDEGAQLVCDTCETRLHLACVNPPVRKAPKSKWFCHDCRAQNATARKEAPASADSGDTTPRANSPSTSGANSKSEPAAKPKKDRYKAAHPKTPKDFDDNWDQPNDSDPFEEVERSSRRKCSKAATAKISQFAKQLRSSQWTENGEMEEEPVPEENRARRPRRSAVEIAKKSRDLPLDNAALLEILDNLMHHKDAWPFLRPVSKSEVPDYHMIIKKPMDFATIKHKLNMLEYKKNAELIADTELLFSNCRLYNEEGSEVFKAGETLEKLFYKLCQDYNLAVNGESSPAGPPAKRPRTVL